MDVDELNDVMAESNRRARSGRAIARAMFVATAGLIGALAYALVVAPPGNMGPQPTDLLATFPGQLGLAGLATGLFWMWRIMRADPEPDARGWRCRR